MNIKVTINHFIKMLFLSFGVSILILFVSFGLMYIYDNKIPIPLPLILLLIAMSFIVGSVYFDKKGAHSIYSMVGGAIVSACATFIITTLIAGMIFPFQPNSSLPGLDLIISVIALLMITSMVVFRVVSYKARA